MPRAGRWIHDLSEVHPGDQIEVWDDGHLHCLGQVEDTAPTLEVVWVREIPGGFRKMVHTHDVDLRHHALGAVPELPQ